jgi:hypothetical protein
MSTTLPLPNNNSVCSDKGIVNSTLGIVCRSIRETCDSQQSLLKQVCNEGLKCIILKNDNLKRCATFDDIIEFGTEVEPERIINAQLDEVKIAVLAIFVIVCLIAMFSIYVYKLHRKLIEKANKNNIKTDTI